MTKKVWIKQEDWIIIRKKTQKKTKKANLTIISVPHYSETLYFKLSRRKSTVRYLKIS